MIHSIKLENVRLYAYHGCLQEEAQIGSDYRVDIEVFTNFQQAIQSDKICHTIDYVQLNKIIKEEMAIRSELLESVCGRILQRIRAEFPSCERIEIQVAKLNPPINGDVQSVSVKIIDEKVA